ncbi:hypothetical protein G7068_07270 [Leucobacter viscericola]|uniref:Uncharacterized protein n=1 Tax=Leucobacter viscericola TaxID=2714935 RepID=A0A6G7XF43_9MICO|nr:hypothetical protein [Leucobacter viscericola]QIK63017.1 hypothetical protein G7068_07270 [Leucobacter viscericola]
MTKKRGTENGNDSSKREKVESISRRHTFALATSGVIAAGLVAAPVSRAEATETASPEEERLAALESAVQGVSSQVDAIQSIGVTNDDVFFSANIAGTGNKGVHVIQPDWSHYNPFFVAPYPLRITSATLAFTTFSDQEIKAQRNVLLALRRFRNGAGAQIVERDLYFGRPAAYSAFPLDGAVWNETSRSLDTGDVVAFGLSLATNLKFPLHYPVTITLKYARTT